LGLLASATVSPYYAQVDFADPNATDSPQWPTGTELAVGSEHAIAVATQSDFTGDVVIEVWSGAVEARERELTLVFEGTLTLSEARAVIGSYVGADLHSVELPPGRHRVRAFTSSAGKLPDRVYFVVGD
jgi:hypothetical protein